MPSVEVLTQTPSPGVGLPRGFESIPRRSVEHLAPDAPFERVAPDALAGPRPALVYADPAALQVDVAYVALSPGLIVYPMPEPGDFLLTHGDSWTSRLIRIGQAIRFHGRSARFTYWNHVALFVDDQGTIVEAIGSGVVKRSVHVYDRAERTIVRIDASTEDRFEAARFATKCVGARYGKLTIISIGLTLLTGTKLSFGIEGQYICSGLVSRALERTTAIFRKDTSHIMPAELAQKFKVPPPPLPKRAN